MDRQAYIKLLAQRRDHHNEMVKACQLLIDDTERELDIIKQRGADSPFPGGGEAQPSAGTVQLNFNWLEGEVRAGTLQLNEAYDMRDQQLRQAIISAERKEFDENARKVSVLTNPIYTDPVRVTYPPPAKDLTFPNLSDDERVNLQLLKDDKITLKMLNKHRRAKGLEPIHSIEAAFKHEEKPFQSPMDKALGRE